MQALAQQEEAIECGGVGAQQWGLLPCQQRCLLASHPRRPYVRLPQPLNIRQR